MDDTGVDLRTTAARFRVLIARLCKNREGTWKPDALGYLLAQTRERLIPLERLSPIAFLELKYLLEAVREMKSAFPNDRRADIALADAYRSLRRAHAEFEKQNDTAHLEVATYRLISDLSVELVILVKGPPEN